MNICPPGYRESGVSGSCRPTSGRGPDVFATAPPGPQPGRPGVGPGYPPTGARGVEALNALPGAAGDLLFNRGRGSEIEAVGGYVDEYADWLRGMARR